MCRLLFFLRLSLLFLCSKAGRRCLSSRGSKPLCTLKIQLALSPCRWIRVPFSMFFSSDMHANYDFQEREAATKSTIPSPFKSGKAGLTPNVCSITTLSANELLPASLVFK